mmetsp:Transcript_11010/g.22971  ORF Transcript_11010/g.22971 Transcript_11010/m.22971 type:complete len:201 (-) Transcript_11010:73-675(-)
MIPLRISLFSCLRAWQLGGICSCELHPLETTTTESPLLTSFTTPRNQPVAILLSSSSSSLVLGREGEGEGKEGGSFIRNLLHLPPICLLGLIHSSLSLTIHTMHARPSCRVLSCFLFSFLLVCEWFSFSLCVPGVVFFLLLQREIKHEVEDPGNTFTFCLFHRATTQANQTSQPWDPQHQQHQHTTPGTRTRRRIHTGSG